jgi:hypothetical protein
MTASTVLSISEAANQCVSAQRRTAELAGIGLMGTPSRKRFGADGNVALDGHPLVKSRSNASLALRTTAKPIAVGGPD